MCIIEITANEQGGHDNHEYHGTLPDGWALIREDVSTLENFPFGEVTAEEVDGVVTMTSWTPGEMPEPEPEPNPQPALDERVTALEESSAEMTEALEMILSGVTE